jgi:hypothetical protein
MLRANIRQRPIMIDLDGKLVHSQVFASAAEQPAEVSMRAREKGWLPYRVRFDESQAAWIVSRLSVRKRKGPDRRNNRTGPSETSVPSQGAKRG